jgi:hypothetical protein
MGFVLQAAGSHGTQGDGPDTLFRAPSEGYFRDGDPQDLDEQERNL